MGGSVGTGTRGGGKGAKRIKTSAVTPSQTSDPWKGERHARIIYAAESKYGASLIYAIPKERPA